MSSFFEKLKKGMGVEETAKEESSGNESEEKEEEALKEKSEEEKPKKPKNKKRRDKEDKEESPKEKKDSEENDDKKDEEKTEDGISQKIETKKIMEQKEEKKSNEKWASFNKEEEGQLAIDVYQTEEELVIQSAIAGVKPDSLDISIEGDMITIRGSREKPSEEGKQNYFYQECFWGPFSRQIILSVDIDPTRTDANLKDGILTIRMPKIERDKKRKITVK